MSLLDKCCKCKQRICRGIKTPSVFSVLLKGLWGLMLTSVFSSKLLNIAKMVVVSSGKGKKQLHELHRFCAILSSFLTNHTDTAMLFLPVYFRAPKICFLLSCLYTV